MNVQIDHIIFFYVACKNRSSFCVYTCTGMYTCILLVYNHAFVLYVYMYCICVHVYGALVTVCYPSLFYMYIVHTCAVSRMCDLISLPLGS